MVTMRLVISRDLKLNDSKSREAVQINMSICVRKKFYKNVTMDQTQNHLYYSPMSYFRSLGYEISRKVHYSCQHSACVMNEWSHSFLPPICFHGMERDYFRLYKDVFGLVILFEYGLITC